MNTGLNATGFNCNLTKCNANAHSHTGLPMQSVLLYALCLYGAGPMLLQQQLVHHSAAR
jgi:hypothetical protein